MVLIPASSLLLIWGSELQLLNRGSWGAPLLGAGSLYSILSLTNSNFLCTELYYCFTHTQFNLLTVKVIPLIPSTGCTCYLHRCISYFDSLAGSEVNMQQLLPQRYNPVQTRKAWVLESDNAARSSKRSKAMHNLSTHRLQWHDQQVPFPTAWTASVTWYMRQNIAKLLNHPSH